MKQALKTVFAIIFTFLIVWNVSGLPVFMLHKSHTQECSPVKNANHSNQKIFKAGFTEECQCAMHMDANNFSFPINFISISDNSERLFRELPPELVLRDGKTILNLSGSRAPPALA